MVHPVIGEVFILNDGRAVQVLAKLSYGVYLCWVDQGDERRGVEILNIVDLYHRSAVIQTRSVAADELNFDLN